MTMLVSIIVKALNEERRIAACLESALRATAHLSSELILVDSLSSDDTVAIAKRYAVRIVQFDSPDDRGCGAAVELGWRHARGEFVYVLDADMQMQPGFIDEALAYLKQHEDVAAVAGNLVDTRLRTLADEQRARRAEALTAAKEVAELGGGGLYRASAVTQTGYLAHRALAAYEEAELGVRLRALGWKLVRLPNVAVLHEGHAESNWQMLRRLWRNGRVQSSGMLIRSSSGKPWFGMVLRKLAHIVAVPVMHGAALSCGAAVAWWAGPSAGLAAWMGFWATALLAIIVYKRSAKVGAWHLILWHYWAAGALVGLTRKISDPLAPIPAHELTNAADRLSAVPGKPLR